MLTIELDDELGGAIERLAANEHKPVKQFVQDVLMAIIDDCRNKSGSELEKQHELKAFFQPYQQDMTGFKFNREDAYAARTDY